MEVRVEVTRTTTSDPLSGMNGGKCRLMAEASSLAREEIPAVARDWQARPSSEGRGEERRRENEAIIEALADSREV
ncbi:hypothetical protein AAC387_Pa05g2837 [Persea americana]